MWQILEFTNSAASFWRCVLMNDDDYASGSSKCALTQAVKLSNSLCMKMAVFLDLPTINNNVRIF